MTTSQFQTLHTDDMHLLLYNKDNLATLPDTFDVVRPYFWTCKFTCYQAFVATNWMSGFLLLNVLRWVLDSVITAWIVNAVG